MAPKKLEERYEHAQLQRNNSSFSLYLFLWNTHNKYYYWCYTYAYMTFPVETINRRKQPNAGW